MDTQPSMALGRHDEDDRSEAVIPQPSTSSCVLPPKKRKRRALSDTEKIMVSNVYKHVFKEKLDEEKQGQGIPNVSVNKNDCVLKTSEILGISRTSIYKVLRESKENESFSAPNKPGPKTDFKDKNDDFTFSAIRRKVHAFFHNNESQTVAKCPLLNRRDKLLFAEAEVSNSCNNRCRGTLSMEGEDSMDETMDTCMVTSGASKHPTFRKAECEALVELVEQHKAVLMSRQINGAALRAKDRVWLKIGHSFNARGFPVRRSVDHLRVKWENLKKSTRKKTSQLEEACFSERDELTRRVLALMCQAHDAPLVAPNAGLNESGEANVENGQQRWEEFLQHNGDSESSQQNGDDGQRMKYRRESRSMSFSPHACNVLLQCVRAEKKYIFSSLTNGKANRAKNLAWLRITQAFNKRMPNGQRSTKVLRTKFMNMKKRARAEVAANGPPFGSALGGGNDVTTSLFKKEKEEDPDNGIEGNEETQEGFDEVFTARDPDEPGDPLSSVLNGYTHSESDRLHDDCLALNQESARLKIELLKYQMETAKMERERVAAAAQGEATLLALRLRSARLGALDAARRLPPHHPALRYPPAERPAAALLDDPPADTSPPPLPPDAT